MWKPNRKCYILLSAVSSDWGLPPSALFTLGINLSLVWLTNTVCYQGKLPFALFLSALSSLTFVSNFVFEVVSSMQKNSSLPICIFLYQQLHFHCKKKNLWAWKWNIITSDNSVHIWDKCNALCELQFVSAGSGHCLDIRYNASVVLMTILTQWIFNLEKSIYPLYYGWTTLTSQYFLLIWQASGHFTHLQCFLLV